MFSNIYKSKWFSFLFPVPSIIFLIIYGLIIAFSETTEGPMTIGYWFVYMTICFLFIIIPFDIIQWLFRKIVKYCKKNLIRDIIYPKSINEIDIKNVENEYFQKQYSENRDSLSKIKVKIADETFMRECNYYTIKQDRKEFENLFPNKSENIYVPISTSEFIENQKREQIQRLITVLSLIIEKKKIIDYDNMNGHEFEYFCAKILKNNGFINVEVTRGSGDHGIDILAEKDTIEYAIQCKCYSSNIGNSAIQQANAGKIIYKKDIAVVLTNQYFTPQAKEEAKILGVKLWDRDKLNKLIENSTK